MGIMRDWINRSFNKQLISKSMFSTAYNKDEIEVRRFVIFFFTNNISIRAVEPLIFVCVPQLWNNILSIRFYNEDITTEWRLKFTMDFEGKYKKV